MENKDNDLKKLERKKVIYDRSIGLLLGSGIVSNAAATILYINAKKQDQIINNLKEDTSETISLQTHDTIKDIYEVGTVYAIALSTTLLGGVICTFYKRCKYAKKIRDLKETSTNFQNNKTSNTFSKKI